jgi:hypothetical protein
MSSMQGMGMPMSPQQFLIEKAICMATGLVIFMLLLWLISLVPIIGRKLKMGVTYLLTKLTSAAGITNCGYKNKPSQITSVTS